MKIILNSEVTEIPENTSVSDLAHSLGAVNGMTAFAVNGNLVKRSDHSSFIINEGDEVIMIGAAYGG